MTTTTNKTSNVTYLNTTRDNMLEWKRAFETTCDKHPERLLPVVTDNNCLTTSLSRIDQEVLPLM